MLAELALDTGLLVALDAGDINSYPGDGQLWINTAPMGRGTDFRRGGGTGTSADDPSFNGTPGGLSPSEYFSFDGNDWFSEAGSGWGDDAFHTSDAQVTIMAVTYIPSVLPMSIFSNCRCSQGGVNSRGVVFFRRTNPASYSWFQEGNNNQGYMTTMAATAPTNDWSFAALSVNANGGTSDMVWFSDGVTEPYPNEMELYGTGDADRGAAIGADGDGGSRVQAGARIAMMAIWSRALSAEELGAVYARIRAERFPSLP